MASKAALVFVLGLALSPIGCHRDPAAQLAGTWELTNPGSGRPIAKYVFAADGTYTDELSPDVPIEADKSRRTWKLEDNGHLLRCYSDGLPSGVFVVEISKDRLTFKNSAGTDAVYQRK